MECSIMKEYDLQQLLNNKELVNSKIEEFLKKALIIKQDSDELEIQGHVQKAEHNLAFIKDNLNLGYYDWCMTGCYYASYHMVLALIMTKGYSSKNHLATLCVLIKEFYNQGIEQQDIEMLDQLFIDYHDLLFYVESKNKREEATYSSKRYYEKSVVEQLRIKTVLFVTKVKGMLQENKP